MLNGNFNIVEIKLRKFPRDLIFFAIIYKGCSINIAIGGVKYVISNRYR